MTMTDVRKPKSPFGAHLDKARRWLRSTGRFSESECSTMGGFRVMVAMDLLYTGGWDGFEADCVTVENASEWELSW